MARAALYQESIAWLDIDYGVVFSIDKEVYNKFREPFIKEEGE